VKYDRALFKTFTDFSHASYQCQEVLFLFLDQFYDVLDDAGFFPLIELGLKLDIWAKASNKRISILFVIAVKLGDVGFKT
jgi:hypothetical protein